MCYDVVYLHCVSLGEIYGIPVYL